MVGPHSGHQKVWFQALKHQKFVYLAQAGPYRDATVRDAVLAERVEALASQEHSSWSAAQTEPAAAQRADQRTYVALLSRREAAPCARVDPPHELVPRAAPVTFPESAGGRCRG